MTCHMHSCTTSHRVHTAQEAYPAGPLQKDMASSTTRSSTGPPTTLLDDDVSHAAKNLTAAWLSNGILTEDASVPAIITELNPVIKALRPSVIPSAAYSLLRLV